MASHDAAPNAALFNIVAPLSIAVGLVNIGIACFWIARHDTPAS